MIYLLCVIIVCGSAFVGKVISNKYVLRDEFFKEILYVLTKIKNNISFKQDKIDSVLKESLSEIQGPAKKHIAILIEKYEAGCLESLKTDKNFKFLKENEINSVIRFFTQIGDSSAEVETKNIESQIVYFNELYNDAKQTRKTNEGLSYKLSIAIGIVICILIA